MVETLTPAAQSILDRARQLLILEHKLERGEVTPEGALDTYSSARFFTGYVDRDPMLVERAWRRRRSRRQGSRRRCRRDRCRRGRRL